MSTLPDNKIDNIIEAAIFASAEPLSLDKLLLLFPEDNQFTKEHMREAIARLQESYQDSAIELKEVASGYRFQVKQDFAQFVQRLEEQKPPKYSRSFLETLALIAYRQPITRGEIEDIRGVAVNTAVIKTLLERDWIKIAGYRDLPGKPALLATTKTFLDYFNLKSLKELPPLSELVDFEALEKQLGLQLPTPIQTDVSEESLLEESAHETSDEALQEVEHEMQEEALEADAEKKTLDAIEEEHTDEEIMA